MLPALRFKQKSRRVAAPVGRGTEPARNCPVTPSSYHIQKHHAPRLACPCQVNYPLVARTSPRSRAGGECLDVGTIDQHFHLIENLRDDGLGCGASPKGFVGVPRVTDDMRATHPPELANQGEQTHGLQERLPTQNAHPVAFMGRVEEQLGDASDRDQPSRVGGMEGGHPAPLAHHVTAAQENATATARPLNERVVIVTRDPDDWASLEVVGRLVRRRQDLLGTRAADVLLAAKKVDEVTANCVWQSLRGFDEERPGRVVENESDLRHGDLLILRLCRAAARQPEPPTDP